jgi:signal transduction histidine kinase
MLKNFTVLYVEDDRSTVENIRDILNNRVKELYVAYDGKEGIDSYTQNKPDIILTDINMPKLNGIEMSKKIKELNIDIPIIIFTAFNENTLLQQSVDIGVDGYITKPVVSLKKLLMPLEKVASRLQGRIDKDRANKLLEIQSKTAAVGEMIGNIAHQWRQPLSIISMQTNSLRASIELEESITNNDLLRFIENIDSQTKYLSKTIDDFRDFLRADTSKKEWANIKNIVEDVESLTSHTMKNSNIIYIKDLNNLDIKIYVNPNQILQVLLNVINNSKDAIIINNVKDKYIFINAIKDEKNVTISIKDSGGGISEEMMDRLFEPYTTSKNASNGTGLGLYISYKIITKGYNGSIEAKNIEYEYNEKKLKGAQFSITIPID